jgi:hypothetical protein
MPNITRLTPPAREGNSLLTQEERRLAIQIAGQLPNDPMTALRVLDLARQITLEYLGSGSRPFAP